MFEHDFFYLQYGVIYTWMDSSQPPLVPLASQKSEKCLKKLLSLNIAMIEFGVKTHVYFIQLDQTARFYSFMTSLTHNWPLMTLYDLIWPQIILNLRQILSRNICIFDIFRPTGPIWPLLDGFDLSLTSDDPNWH